MFKLITKNLTKKQWIYFIFVITFIVCQVWLELKIPEYMKDITILVQTEGSAFSDILLAGAKMIICAIVSAVAAATVSYIIARISASISLKLRSSVFNKVQDFSSNEVKKFSTASLITRSTNDITQIQMFILMGVSALIKAPIMAVWAIIKISSKSYQWSIATAGAIGVIFVMVLIVVSIVIPKFKKIQSQTDNLNKVARENLTGLRVVRAYNAEQYQNDKFQSVNNELTSTQMTANRTMSIMWPTMGAIMNFLPLSIYWIGAALISQAHFTEKLNLFSDMVVFSSYAMQIIMSFIMLVMVFILLPRAAVSSKRINEVLNTQSSVQDGNKEIKTTKKGCVEFKNVTFKYQDAEENVLNNISFKCNEGDVVAFIGSTGSGKSTLINLVPRFYDVTDGEILINDINVKDYKLADLRNKIGYISQRAVLFSGSVESNVALGDTEEGKPTDIDIASALKISQSKDFVDKMDEGVKSHISQGGKNVSGGQKQRLSIARAIAKKPEILIFDDSFSALDYKTDMALRTALNKDLNKTTCLIVAQRIGTIKEADQIIVLDEGKTVGIGKHNDLLKTCEVYKEIALSQLSEEELNG